MHVPYSQTTRGTDLDTGIVSQNIALATSLGLDNVMEMANIPFIGTNGEEFKNKEKRGLEGLGVWYGCTSRLWKDLK